MEKRRCDIGQNTVLNLGIFVFCDENKRHRIERVCGVGSAVGILGIVGITVVGDYNHLITVSLGSLDSVMETVVDGFDSLLDSGVDSGMTHHVAIGIVDNDPVIFLGIDCFDQLVFHLISAHLGLQVVGSYLGRRYKNAVFAFEGSFTAAVEEEGYVSIFFCLGDVELLAALLKRICTPVNDES